MSNKPKTHKPIFITESVKKRFWTKVKKTDSCWFWTAAINPDNYGVMKIDGTNRSAHRISYAIHKGDIPENLMILHRCHDKKCVNPEHLYAGNAQQNSKDEIDRKNTRHYKCATSSKYIGVRWDESRKGWVSSVYFKRKYIDIGRHISEVDAARNHDRIRYMKYGLKDRLNFPEEYNLSD